MAHTCPSGSNWEAAVNKFGEFNSSLYYYFHGEQMGTTQEVEDYLVEVGQIIRPNPKINNKYSEPENDNPYTNPNLYQKGAISIVENIVGPGKKMSDDVQDWQVELINQKLKDYDNRDVQPWVYKKAQSGRYYISGYNNQETIRNDYYSPTSYWRDINYMIADEADFDKQDSLAQFEPNPEFSRPDIGQILNTQANEVVSRILKALPSQLDINYNFISEEEATEITKGTKTPYRSGSGQRAFFLNGQVYFVGPTLTMEMFFHEFSHPFVKTIIAQNKDLFDRLYNDLIQTHEGQEIIKYVGEKYDMDPKDIRFQEEVIVRALTASAKQAIDEIEPSTGFKKIIDNILYQLKQLFRKILGRTVDISKLETTTSLNDLTDMLLKGDKFDLDQDVITDKDIADYVIEQDKYVKEVLSIPKEDLVNAMTKGYDIALKQTEVILNNRNFSAMRKILVDEFQRGDLYDIKQQLGSFTAKNEQAINEQIGRTFIQELEREKERAEAFITALTRVNNVIGKINTHLKELTQDLDDRHNLIRAYHYAYLTKYWGEYVEELLDMTEISGIDPDSEFTTLLTSIQENVRRANKQMIKINKAGLVDVLVEVLMPMSRNMEAKYKQKIADRKKKGHKQSIIDTDYVEFYGMTEDEWNLFQELEGKQGKTVDEIQQYNRLKNKSYEGFRLTPEKISLSLEGKLEDANFANSFFEGYMYNADPVVGGFALYVKNNMTDVINKAYAKHNQFLKDIDAPLKAIGYNPLKTGDLASKVTFADEVGRYDHATRELTPVKVLTFLNAFKGHRLALDEANRNVDITHAEWVRSGSKEAQSKYYDAVEQRRKLKADYFHQEYVQEYYNRYQHLVHGPEDEIGKEAAARKDDILQRIKNLTAQSGNRDDDVLLEDKLDNLWAEYRQLHSKFDRNGKIKKNDYTASNGDVIVTNDLSVAERLIEYRDKTSKFYERVYRKGLFERALYEKEQQLITERNLEEGGPEFIAAREAWIEKNTRVVLKDSYYERRQEIVDQITELLAKVPGKLSPEAWARYKELRSKRREGIITDTESSELDSVTNQYKSQLALNTLNDKLWDIVKLHKNQAGELIGSSMSAEALEELKTVEEKIIRYKKDNKKLRKTSGLNEIDRKVLYMLYEDLDELTTKEATDDYCGVVNDFLDSMDQVFIKDLVGHNGINPISADYILRKDIVAKLKKESSEFEEWFDRNHILKERYDTDEGAKVTYWERLTVWSMSKPKDESYYESFTVKKQDGSTEVLNRMPSSKYYLTLVKKEYRTERIIGQTVDNKGGWLPRLKDARNPQNDPVDDRFMNERYFELKEAYDTNPQSEDGKIFTALKVLAENHLQNQQGLSYKSKLYLDVPRFRMNTLEALQAHSAMKNIKGTADKKFPFIGIVVDAFKRFYQKRKDDAESDFNAEDDFRLITTDMFDNELSNIHIGGLYDVDIDFVSKDIIHSMMKYMLSAERQKKLIEINPVAQALRTNLEETKMDKRTKDGAKMVNKFNLLNRNMLSFIKKKDRTVRSYAINNLIDREFYSKQNTGWLSDSRSMNNLSTLMFKRAAFGYFALNIPSAIKNTIGPKWQGMLETVAGEHMTLKSLVKGESRAIQTMGEISFQIYKGQPKGLNTQITDIFDTAQGRVLEKFGESKSRTIAHDIANLSWLYNFRKWTETEATMHLFFGMMEHQKIDQAGKEISYVDAWEVVDGQIQLKPGINVRYGHLPTTHTIELTDSYESVANQYNIPLEEFGDVISKEKFIAIQDKLKKFNEQRENDLEDQDNDQIINRINARYDREIAQVQELKIDNAQFKIIRNRMHQANNNLQGAYSSFDQPEAQRYLAFRFFSFLRRYFIPMFTKRFGHSGRFWDPKGRMNPGLSDNPMGYYMTALRTLTRSFTVDKSYLLSLNKDEKRAWIRTLVEAGSLILLTALLIPALGYDPDDPDRYERLRERSGAMPFLGLTPDDPDREFNLPGFIYNHLLNMTMMVRAENETLVPWPGMGMSDYTSMLNLASLAAGPTIESYSRMFTQLTYEVTDDPSSRYKRDVGPYRWQQEGGSKFITTFMKMIGFTGSSIDPALSIKNQESMRKTAGKLR